MTTFTRKGVRHRFFKTHGSRWGRGKVHLQYWSREYKEWILVCRPEPTGGMDPYYGDVVPQATVTCGTCQKRDPR